MDVPLLREQTLTDPRVRWAPFALSTLIALVTTFSYLTGVIGLNYVGTTFAFVALGFTGYLWFVVAPDPPYDWVCGGAFLALGFGFAFLSAPGWFASLPLLPDDIAIARAIAAASFGLAPGLIWAVYSGLAVRLKEAEQSSQS